jgi:hypothetical protein
VYVYDDDPWQDGKPTVGAALIAIGAVWLLVALAVFAGCV